MSLKSVLWLTTLLLVNTAVATVDQTAVELRVQELLDRAQSNFFAEPVVKEFLSEAITGSLVAQPNGSAWTVIDITIGLVLMLLVSWFSFIIFKSMDTTETYKVGDAIGRYETMELMVSPRATSTSEGMASANFQSMTSS